MNENHPQDVEYLKNQLHVTRNELNNLRQQIKTLTHAHRKECEEIRGALQNWKCLECRNRLHQGEMAQEVENNDLRLNYIGIINTQFPEKRATPRQPPICGDMIAKLTLNNDVFTNPSHALEGLEEYSHMWILFHFHRNDSTHIRAKVAPPRLNGLRTGVFATRAPHRPSPIGLSLVKIDRIMDNTIYFRGVDMVDQTPVLDIKPYIPQYDNPSLLSNMQPPNTSNNTLSLNLNNDLRVGQEVVASTSGNLASNVENETEGAIGYDSMNNRVMDGQEFRSRCNEPNQILTPARIGEREAPDGEEEENIQTSGQISGNTLNTQIQTQVNEELVRVPAWVKKPGAFGVLFKERALAQLNQLGSEAEEKKAMITAVLCQDPRNNYLKDRLGTQYYIFKISNLNVACRYNEETHIVTVYKIFSNSVSDSDE
ncbi:tRNA (adenine(37)-N6)-methyltransferase-like [Onthophagus taurus]|uniref:tRNA (adenine(37)-N6)-methyltransferase-like n=1 Tax=Onthophagus taurus TaxID=166361 RepID=UPI000C2046DC|nr:tRNA (adenine(37)-N6)-methyltransferase-like [Onthophagus taurus]